MTEKDSIKQTIKCTEIEVCDQLQLEVWQGQITGVPGDIVVSSSNNWLFEQILQG